MGLVRKASENSVAAGGDGSIDISTLIRQAVSDEIERRRLESLEPDGKAGSADADDPDLA